MTAPDLLPCPFCGGKPRVHHSRGCEIACPNADCPSEPTVWQWDEAEAIAAWNTRATPAAASAAMTPEVKALVEAARKARDGLQWAQFHLNEAGMKSLSVDVGLMEIDAALAALKGADHG